MLCGFCPWPLSVQQLYGQFRHAIKNVLNKFAVAIDLRMITNMVECHQTSEWSLWAEIPGLSQQN